MIEQLKMLTSNYIINVGVLSWFAAQIIKTLLFCLEHHTLNLERMVGAGGMPSAHSALVCSITVAMAKKTGFSSPEFALALAFASVVMYDAMGVRRAAGEQAKVLNRIMRDLRWQVDGFFGVLNPAKSRDTVPPRDNEPEEPAAEELQREEKELKEFLGHTPLEVLGGALLGILMATLLPAF